MLAGECVKASAAAQSEHLGLGCLTGLHQGDRLVDVLIGGVAPAVPPERHADERLRLGC